MAMAYGLMALKIKIEQEDCGPTEPKTRERSLKRFPSSHFSNGCLYFVCFNLMIGLDFLTSAKTYMFQLSIACTVYGTQHYSIQHSGKLLIQ